MDSLPCNVVLLPSDALADTAIVASQKLASYPTLFTLEVGKYYPHVSVYMLQLKTADIEKAKERLATVAAKTQMFDLITANFGQSEGFFDVEYDNTEQLSTVQAEVVQALNPIRDGMRQKDHQRMQVAVGEALANYQQYGWASIGSLYRPHLTLTRFNDENTAPEAPADLAAFNGVFPKLGLFEMGDNGTCVRLIAEFNVANLLEAAIKQ